MAKNENKKGFSIYWLFGKIGDILFIPIIVISLFASISMFAKKNKNTPTSVFGYSLVNVLSHSMTSEGYLKGDTLIVKEINPYKIKLGDVIAFYNYRDIAMDAPTAKQYVERYKYNGGLEVDFSDSNIEYGVNLQNYPKKHREGQKTVQDAINSNASIFFHRVIAIYVDDFGNLFFITKGSDNASHDGYIREDFVVGKYVTTPRPVRDIMSFCSSPNGMIALVCIPLSILVLMQCFSIIKQVEVMSIEKQLVNGKKRFNGDDIAKSFNGNEIELYNKVYLYFLTGKEEREQIKNFMWSDLFTKSKLSKKEMQELNTLQKAEKQLKTSKRGYWECWISNTKGHDHKKIKQHYDNLMLSSVFKKKEAE